MGSMVRCEGSWREYVRLTSGVDTEETWDYVNCDAGTATFKIKQEDEVDLLREVFFGSACDYVKFVTVSGSWQIGSDIEFGLCEVCFELDADKIQQDAENGVLPFHIRQVGEEYRSVWPVEGC